MWMELVVLRVAGLVRHNLGCFKTMRKFVLGGPGIMPFASAALLQMIATQVFADSGRPRGPYTPYSRRGSGHDRVNSVAGLVLMRWLPAGRSSTNS